MVTSEQLVNIYIAGSDVICCYRTFHDDCDIEKSIMNNKHTINTKTKNWYRSALMISNRVDKIHATNKNQLCFNTSKYSSTVNL